MKRMLCRLRLLRDSDEFGLGAGGDGRGFGGGRKKDEDNTETNDLSSRTAQNGDNRLC